MSEKVDRFPFERQAGYITLLAGTGTAFASVAWIVADFFLPHRKFEYGKWAFVGGALGAATALSWLFSNGLLY